MWLLVINHRSHVRIPETAFFHFFMFFLFFFSFGDAQVCPLTLTRPHTYFPCASPPSPPAADAAEPNRHRRRPNHCPGRRCHRWRDTCTVSSESLPRSSSTPRDPAQRSPMTLRGSSSSSPCSWSPPLGCRRMDPSGELMYAHGTSTYTYIRGTSYSCRPCAYGSRR